MELTVPDTLSDALNKAGVLALSSNGDLPLVRIVVEYLDYREMVCEDGNCGQIVKYYSNYSVAEAESQYDDELRLLSCGRCYACKHQALAAYPTWVAMQDRHGRFEIHQCEACFKSCPMKDWKRKIGSTECEICFVKRKSAAVEPHLRAMLDAVGNIEREDENSGLYTWIQMYSTAYTKLLKCEREKNVDLEYISKRRKICKVI